MNANSLDSLENVLRSKITGNNVDEQLDAYFELGKEYLLHKETDKALDYLLAAESLAEKLKKYELRLEIVYKLGVCYNAQHDYDKAIEVLTQLIKDLTGTNGKELGDACYRLAKVYQVKGNNELAFDYHFRALQIREEQGDRKGIARSHYQVGGIHFFQGNYHKSIEYYEKCLKIAKEINSEVLELSCYGAIGGAYSRLGDVDLSLEYNMKAYEITIASNRKSGLAYISFNLGDNYQTLGDVDKALKYFNQAHKLYIESNDRWGQIGSNKSIGEIHITKGNNKEGLEYLNKSLEIAQSLGARPRLLDVYKSFARNLEDMGDYKKANWYYKEFLSLKDSLVNEATLQKMSDTKMQYEISSKEKAIQKRDTQLQETYRNFLIVGLLFLLVFLYLMYAKYKTQAKNNELQREQNQKIRQQNDQLEEAHLIQMETNQLLKTQNEQSLVQNEKLERKNEELKRFAYIASHDLKEPLRNIGSFATLLKRRFKGQLGSDADEYIDFITTNVSRMYDLLHEVLMYSKLENEEIIHDWVSINEIVQTVRETLRGKIMEQNVQFKVANLPEVQGHRSHLLQLFQNLVSNSIKYNQKENPLVEVGIKENFEGHDLVYFVKDNGIGIDMEFKERVFEIFKRLHGKDEFEGTGVGLAICKKIVMQNNGDIWVESEIGKGSTFYFTLNINTKMAEANSADAEMFVEGVNFN